MPRDTPSSITVTRLAAGLQVTLLFAFIAVDLTAATLMGRSATDYADAQTIGIIVAILAAVPLVLVGVPLILLRRGRPNARIALIIVESLLLLKTLPWAESVLAHGPTDPIAVLACAVLVVPAVVAVVALCGRSAAGWSTPTQS